MRFIINENRVIGKSRAANDLRNCQRAIAKMYEVRRNIRTTIVTVDGMFGVTIECDTESAAEAVRGIMDGFTNYGETVLGD